MEEQKFIQSKNRGTAFPKPKFLSPLDKLISTLSKPSVESLTTSSTSDSGEAVKERNKDNLEGDPSLKEKRVDLTETSAPISIFK